MTTQRGRDCPVHDRAFSALRHVLWEVATRHPGPVAIPGGYLAQRYLEHDDHTIVAQVEDISLFGDDDAWEAWQPDEPIPPHSCPPTTDPLAGID